MFEADFAYLYGVIGALTIFSVVLFAMTIIAPGPKN